MFVGRQLDGQAGRLGRGYDVDAHGLHGRTCLERVSAGLPVHASADVAEHAVAAGERSGKPVAHLEGLGLEGRHEAGELVGGRR